jgi:2,5-diketo-D-gluconate reductase B
LFEKKRNLMNQDPIKTKSVSVPGIGFGTYKLTGHEAIDAVEFALGVGYRHIDTARFYDNEIEIGRAVKNSGLTRESVFITTKIFPNDFRRLEEATEDSLRKLKSDYVDLLLLHWPSDDESNKIAVDALNEVVNKGLTKSIGVSNFNIEKLSKAIARAPIICNQVEYHPYISQEKMLAFLKEHNMIMTAYSPLAKGKVVKDWIIMELAGNYDKTVSQVVIRWLYQQGNIAVIPKASSKERINENFDIFDFELLDEDMRIISGLSMNHRITNPGWSPIWD